MEKTSNNDWVAKYLSGNMTSKEEEDFLLQLNQDPSLQNELAESAAVWEQTSNKKNNLNVDNAWQIVNSATSRGRVVQMLGQWKLIAASVVLLIAAALWWNQAPKENWQTIQTIAGQTQEIGLPDGSKIVLNENSQLSYREGFEVRDVRLEGEAFFDVARNEKKPFTIYSDDTQTRVLGTSFNIRAYREEEAVVVTVESGKVAFSSVLEEEKKTVLTAGYQAALNKENRGLIKQKTEDQNVLSWKSNHLLFDDILIKQVIVALERHFDTTIKVSDPKINNCRFKANYTAPQLKEVLEMLAFTLNLEIEYQQDTILLKGNGC